MRGASALLTSLLPDKLAFVDQPRGWQAFWVAWRRIAAGIEEGAQVRLRDLTDRGLGISPGTKKAKDVRHGASEVMLETASSLERVPPDRRVALGTWIVEKTWTDRDPALWAALGRLGARAPTYATLDHVLSPLVAERWLDHLLREKWDRVPTANEAAVRLSRYTADRARDVPETLRREVARRLAQSGAAADKIRLVTELVPIDDGERVAFLGEDLPVGLTLL